MAHYSADDIDWLRPPEVEGEQGDWTSRWLLQVAQSPGRSDELAEGIHPDVKGVELTSLGGDQYRLEVRSTTHPLEPEGYLAVDAVLTSIHDRLTIVRINDSARSKWRSFRRESKVSEGSIRMSTADYPDRRFQLWEYQVSHGGLLIRSPKGPSAPFNVDILFNGVELVACPRLLRGIELVEASPEDLQRVAESLGAPSDEDRVFVLSSEGVRHLVVASSMGVFEHDGEIFDSPF